MTSLQAYRIHEDDSNYPLPVKEYLAEAPKTIAAIGNFTILQNKSLAVFSSSKCPGKVILQTYDLMKNIREAGITVISGFHSPMESECLNILLKGRQPIIFCPARSIEGMRIKPEYMKPLEEGRLLILSPFAEKAKRISSERALERNRLIAAIGDSIMEIKRHISP
jgi:predicted Rossmann fold nucleotide-binding protein DprA/Smf involved in DNA uptake